MLSAMAVIKLVAITVIVSFIIGAIITIINAIIDTTPDVLAIVSVAPITNSTLSDTNFPTTGITPDTAVCVAFTVIPSTLVVTDVPRDITPKNMLKNIAFNHNAVLLQIPPSFSRFTLSEMLVTMLNTIEIVRSGMII